MYAHSAEMPSKGRDSPVVAVHEHEILGIVDAAFVYALVLPGYVSPKCRTYRRSVGER